jgi:ferredoxin-NADP reductase/DMSO/TMAO reductase YedYZ heme-binding membrane subunit
MLRNRWIKALAFAACLMPLIWLGWRALQENLTANPIEFITHFTGDWTIRFIVLTLAISPLRRLFGLPDLLRFRRMLGLFAFFYGSLHFLTWFWLDKYFDFREIVDDVVKRRFITVGFLGLLLMLPLAITSTKGWVRRLGPVPWQRLHRLVYVTAAAGVVHYYWLVKSDIRWPLFYGVVVGLLLAARLLRRRKAPDTRARSLQISSIVRQTGDTVTLRFPLSVGMPLGAKPGQFLTFDWVVNGKKVPRSYSVSSSPRRNDYVEVTVKQQGVVSTFLNREAQPGLNVTAHGPFGQFCFDETRHKRIVLLAGGSGITPIMSMLRYIEEVAPETQVNLFYGVRGESDVIFGEDLANLQKRLPAFRYILIASRPGPDWTGLHGYLSRSTLEDVLENIDGRTFFLCGPPPFMQSMKEILSALGVPAAQTIEERFTIGTPSSMADPNLRCSVEFAQSGGTFDCSSSDSLLDVAESHGIEIPYSCRVGQCGTCATRVLEGEVEMEIEDGLESARKAQGYRLLCVGRARGLVRLDA